MVEKRVTLPFLILLLAVAYGLPALAGLEIAVVSHLESLSGSGWRARQIDLRLERKFKGESALRVTIEHLDLPPSLPSLQGIDLQCPDFFLSGDRVQCSNGQLHIGRLQGRTVSAGVTFNYRSATQTLNIDIANLDLGGGRVAVQGNVVANTWTVDLDAVAVDAATLADLLRPWVGMPMDEQDTNGQLTIEATLSGQGRQLNTARFQLAGRGLTFSAAAGRYAVQGLAGRLEGHWGDQPEAELFTARLQLDAGQLYIDPIFLDLPAAGKPVTVDMAGQRRTGSLVIERLSLQHDEVLQAHGSLVLGLEPSIALRQVDVTFTEAGFPEVYSVYLQPFLVGTVLGDLQTQGHLRGRLVYDRKTIQALELSPSRLDVDDRQGRFGIEGLTGRLTWTRNSTPRRSELSWDGGHLYRLDIGAAELVLESTGDEFRLLNQTRIPVLDGAVVIDRLAGQGLDVGGLSWQFEGLLTPISMESLSRSLGWPILSGKLSGEVPNVHYADRTLEVGGALRVRLFEGEIIITSLRMEHPLGVVPKLFADLAINHLDLLTLTQTFDFGRITGKLEGKVNDLRLENWAPVYFDAWLASPQEQRSQRQISQRAVRNLSALGGGGAGAVLSRGFLSLFEEFNYRRLGIRCRLVNGICEMGGIAPVDSGYYLVQGQGVPRIDVIGYNRLVDWNVLLARLRAAIQSEGPVVR